MAKLVLKEGVVENLLHEISSCMLKAEKLNDVRTFAELLQLKFDIYQAEWNNIEAGYWDRLETSQNGELSELQQMWLSIRSPI